MIASMPVEDQEERKNCWAYVAAYITSCTYSVENPSVRNLTKIRCSPQELSDWVYSLLELNKEIDEYGYYACHGATAFEYIQEVGISLLKNYEIEEFVIRDIETTYNERLFGNMLASRGDRIFIDRYVSTFPDNSLHGKPIFSIEFVTQILHQGMAYGRIYYCSGCEHCDGFDNFDGVGVYDQPSHPKGYVYKNHAVAVLGAGNLNGIDYIRIRNSWGTSFAKSGEADMHIKFFKELIQVSGTRKEVAKTGGGK